jgi:hypothetical protein
MVYAMQSAGLIETIMIFLVYTVKNYRVNSGINNGGHELKVPEF